MWYLRRYLSCLLRLWREYRITLLIMMLYVVLKFGCPLLSIVIRLKF